MFGMDRKVVKTPYKGYKLQCCVYGDIHSRTPLVMLHGGPGGCIERYESFEILAATGQPIIMYDQLGCGYSKVPAGHKELWTVETYKEEIDNVLDYLMVKDYYLLGHSWGGMLALEYILDKPKHMPKKLILYSTLPSTKIWNDEHLEMIKDYPEEELKALLAEKDGIEVDKDILKQATKHFYNDHVGKKSDRKYKLRRRVFPKTNLEIYNYMWGPSELFGTGTLKDYDVTPKLKNIGLPTLILHGELDESTIKMNELMHNEIKHSQYHMLKGCHHGSYNEKPEEVMEVIQKFLAD